VRFRSAAFVVALAASVLFAAAALAAGYGKDLSFKANKK
jgi:hypothetical protein